MRLNEEVKCIYKHRRLDNNEIFYIGIGNIKRPYEKTNRNPYWKNLTNKTEYKVEILSDNLTWENAQEAEIQLIKLYGRRDLGLGILVNMTDGGEGNNNFSQETKNKISNSLKGNILSQEIRDKISKNSAKIWKGKHLSKEHRKKLSDSHKGICKDEKHPGSRLILCQETGIFYLTLKSAAIAHNLKCSTLCAMLIGQNPNKTNLIYG